jgi:hypothetical protein
MINYVGISPFVFPEYSVCVYKGFYKLVEVRLFMIQIVCISEKIVDLGEAGYVLYGKFLERLVCEEVKLK